MTLELPYDVLVGTPEPIRRRWQPLRAGILNLFRYDSQTFAFHNGRLLLRGNNGSGKSMAVEVLIPYVLDADLSPQRLSTFGGRDRDMFLWLLGFEKPATRANARAYVWVEFGRRRPDGSAEYFTAGACLEGLRSDTSVKAHYWTTAARVGVQLHLGGPGTEPLTRQAVAAALAELTASGMPGQVHPDAKSHRRAVNEALYGLHDRRFEALRATLLQLRRPKLSDKLNEESLNLILRNSLPPVNTTIVQDLAEGFERLDRHAAAVGELRGVVDDLRSLQASYRRYARVAGAARADAVVASERAIRTAREMAAEAQAELEDAEGERKRIGARQDQIEQRRGEIHGRGEALRDREEYREGRNLESLRELVRSLGGEADRQEGEATGLRRVADHDARSSLLANRAAHEAGEAAIGYRFEAEAASVAAAVDTLHQGLATDVDEIRGRDVDSEEALHAAVAAVRALVPSVAERSQAWSGIVTALRRLQRTAREDERQVQAARTETARAEGEEYDAERLLNAALEADRDATLAWVDALTRWTEASAQLRAGQAPPLPWDPAVALDRAPRWAREAYDARDAQLADERMVFDAAARRWEATAGSWAVVADDLDELAALTTAAGEKAGDHLREAAAYRTEVEVWAAGLRELPLGVPQPAWTGSPTSELPATSLAWADRAVTARGTELAADAARLEMQITAERRRRTELEERRDRLATPGLPDLPTPATRGATRDDRPGAPFYLLVDFAATIGDADRRGIEAAAIGSGLADAWVAPDGRLLDGPDGRLLLDTQLTTTPDGVPNHTATLAGLLVPDAACAAAGVPADVVAALLDRIAVADTARHSHLHGLVVCPDGTWRSGPLAGAHTVATVTLIGAANRETDRLVRLAEAERAVADAQAAEAALLELLAHREAAAERLQAERDSLPSAAAMVAAADAARRATDDVRARRRTTEQRVTEAYRSDTGEPEPPEEVTAAGQDTHAEWVAVAAAVAEDPAHPDAPERLKVLRNGARDTARGWRRAAATLRDRSEANVQAADTARQERDALPTDESVRQSRAGMDSARRTLDGARTRLDTRQEEERAALEHATDSSGALIAALLAEELPGDTDPERLGAAFALYQSQAAQCLNAEAEAVRGTGAAGFAAARALDSTDRAVAATRSANDKRTEHRTKRTKLEALSDAYGLAYGDIVRELDQLSTEDTRLASERDDLHAAEMDCVNKHATATSALATADRMRKDAEHARTTVGAAFLAAARVGVLAAAGLPNAPAGAGDGPSDSPDHDDPGAAGLGVRALRDWATAVREAAGDGVRTVQVVEQAANRVTETRHGLEPRLAGRVIVRDEQRDQLLLLHVNRAGRTYPLHEMIGNLVEELTRDSELLAREEAELFRKFLAGETRREVTTKVRDARTTIRAMTELMASHPTGSGIQVRLRWVPDDKNAPGMQDVVTLMAKDVPLESEKERLQAFFRQRIDRVRTDVDADWTAQLTELLDYRQWWRFQLEYRRSHDDGWTALNSKTHGALSGGEKAVCLHLPLFAAAATYCDSAGVRAADVDGQDLPGCPRLIVLDEVFAGVDEDNRGALFDIVRTLDMDMVATSESEQGFYPQLDGVAVYHLVSSDALGCVLATRTIWDGSTAHQMLDGDLIDAP